jgi:trigger factor
MQVTETSAEGLKRTIQVVIPAETIAARFETKLADLKDKVQLKGFRKGHVPVVHIKKLYGRAVMGEILEETIKDTSVKAIEGRNERPAMQPEIKLPEDQDEIARVLDGKSDLSYHMSFEVLPKFEVADFSGLKLERVVAEVIPEDTEMAIARMVESNTTYEAVEDRAAATGDQVTMDFVGRIDGAEFDGGSATDADLVLGDGKFIPGFEDALIGIKAGERRDVTVTFPAEYPVATLAGKPAVFDVTVKSVGAPKKPEIDDDFAKSVGATDVANLRQLVNEQLQRELDRASRIKLKRELLDALDKAYAFELPTTLVEHEFQQIWAQLEATLKRQGKTIAENDEGKSEDDLRAEYRRIAERRVRLGLLVGEIGDRNKIEVTPDELRRALIEKVREFPGQERMVYEYFEKTPGAVAELRAPIYEEKVIDYMLSQASPTERKVSKEELFKLAEAAATEA